MSAIADVGSEVPTAPLCESLGVCRAVLYRWRQPKLGIEPKPARARHPRSLGPDERQAILDTLNSERFCDASPAEVHATLLEEGTYLASPRTMYRVLSDASDVRERRDHLRHPSYVKPKLLATQPNQVWSWDITKLKGPVKWTCFYLFVILDIFSRHVVGWMVAHARLAERLIEETCTKQNISPGQITIHADRGPAMISKTVALLILRSHSRPQRLINGSDPAYSWHTNQTEAQYGRQERREAGPDGTDQELEFLSALAALQLTPKLALVARLDRNFDPIPNRRHDRPHTVLRDGPCSLRLRWRGRDARKDRAPDPQPRVDELRPQPRRHDAGLRPGPTRDAFLQLVALIR